SPSCMVIGQSRRLASRTIGPPRRTSLCREKVRAAVGAAALGCARGVGLGCPRVGESDYARSGSKSAASNLCPPRVESLWRSAIIGDFRALSSKMAVPVHPEYSVCTQRQEHATEA